MCHIVYINVCESVHYCVYIPSVILYIICTGVETIMSHYTLGWHDQLNEYHEIGEYAEDAFEAVRHAREDVPYLQVHPFSLNIIKEIK